MKNADIKSRHQQDIGRYPNEYKKNKLTHTNNQDKNKKFDLKLHGKKLRLPFSLFRQHQNGWRHFLFMSVGV
jgi:hypothetical protein